MGHNEIWILAYKSNGVGERAERQNWLRLRICYEECWELTTSICHTVGICFSIHFEAILPWAAPSWCLSTGPDNFCLIWGFYMCDLCTGISHWVGSNFLKVVLCLRCFLMSPSSFPLSFCRLGLKAFPDYFYFLSPLSVSCPWILSWYLFARVPKLTQHLCDYINQINRAIVENRGQQTFS